MPLLKDVFSFLFQKGEIEELWKPESGEEELSQKWNQ